MFTFIKKNLQIWMRLSTFANEKERNLIDMCTFKNIPKIRKQSQWQSQLQ